MSEKVVSHSIAQAWLCEAQALWLVAGYPQEAAGGSQTKGLKVRVPGESSSVFTGEPGSVALVYCRVGGGAVGGPTEAFLCPLLELCG